jgi:hypothetical protein
LIPGYYLRQILIVSGNIVGDSCPENDSLYNLEQEKYNVSFKEYLLSIG